MSDRGAGIAGRAVPLMLGFATATVTFRWLGARPRPGSPYLAGGPLLIAHRGGAGLAPENTLLAFERAVQWWGADILELDVQPTRDGEVVVFHDDTLDRTTNGTGPVARRTLAQIRSLDAGAGFSTDGGRSFPFRDRGVRVPTLLEVLQAFPSMRVNVEIKDGRAQRRVSEVVRQMRAEHRVLIAAAERSNRSRFVRYAGAVSASEEELRAFYLYHRLRATAWYRPEVDALQLPERYDGTRVVSPRLIRDAHAKNLAVHVWTVDEEADMRRLLQWGVDGIVTDRPDRLARVLHELFGRPLPPGAAVEDGA